MGDVNRYKRTVSRKDFNDGQEIIESKLSFDYEEKPSKSRVDFDIIIGLTGLNVRINFYKFVSERLEEHSEHKDGCYELEKIHFGFNNSRDKVQLYGEYHNYKDNDVKYMAVNIWDSEIDFYEASKIHLQDYHTFEISF